MFRESCFSGTSGDSARCMIAATAPPSCRGHRTIAPDAPQSAMIRCTPPAMPSACHTPTRPAARVVPHPLAAFDRDTEHRPDLGAGEERAPTANEGVERGGGELGHLWQTVCGGGLLGMACAAVVHEVDQDGCSIGGRLSVTRRTGHLGRRHRDASAANDPPRHSDPGVVSTSRGLVQYLPAESGRRRLDGQYRGRPAIAVLTVEEMTLSAADHPDVALGEQHLEVGDLDLEAGLGIALPPQSGQQLGLADRPSVSFMRGRLREAGDIAAQRSRGPNCVSVLRARLAAMMPRSSCTPRPNEHRARIHSLLPLADRCPVRTVAGFDVTLGGR